MAGAEKPQISLDSLDRYLSEVYIPFVEVTRDIAWPTDPNIDNLEMPVRSENDAEHTVCLTHLGIAIGAERGLDVGEIALLSNLHDLPEFKDGDISVMDLEGRKIKESREADAVDYIENNFPEFPILSSVIRSYEKQDTPEKILVKSLDKLVATMMIMKAGGRTWKNYGYTFSGYRDFAFAQIRPKILDDQVLGWYDQLFESLESNQELYFMPEGQVVGINFSQEVEDLSEITAA